MKNVRIDDLEENLIYHYCSVETFYAIICNKKLWLSDSSYMNDKYEIIWTNNVVLEVIETLKYRFQDNQEKLTKLDEFKEIYNSLENKKHYFISFSQDGDLLSQWRGYGDDAYGVSIGFEINNVYKKEHLAGQIGDELNIITPDKDLGYEYIDYNIHASIEKGILDILSDNSIYHLWSVILKESATASKHPSFQEEQEVRITYTHEDNFSKDERLSDKKFRAKNGELIPYYEFDFTRDESLLINNIVLGSKCKLNESDLSDFLKSNGFEDIDIIRSESSYR
jgi:hypothetical protein